MRKCWKRMLFALWLLSLALGFALPALPDVAEREVPLQAAWAQNQGGSHGYVAGSQSHVAYDAELPSATTEGFGDFVAAAPTTPPYDLFSLATISVVGVPSAPPAENAEFLAAKSVATPYGPAVQSMTAEARAALSQVENGATLYKGGVLGRSETGASQFLSLENPLNPGYAGRYGLPPQNANFEFIMTGRLTAKGVKP